MTNKDAIRQAELGDDSGLYLLHPDGTEYYFSIPPALPEDLENDPDLALLNLPRIEVFQWINFDNEWGAHYKFIDVIELDKDPEIPRLLAEAEKWIAQRKD